jgi:cytochrome oxidase Cu insertion factor (SCO1/SenC/PrrC family)
MSAQKLLMVALMALGAVSAPAWQAPLPDVTTIGPKVGQVVPDFSLIDQNGRRQTLKSVAGPKGTMLVFFRSADW